MKRTHYFSSITLLLIVSSFCINKSYAQLSMTPYVSFNKLGTANMAGFGIRAELAELGNFSFITEKLPIYGGVTFGFGSSSSTNYVTANSSTTQPFQLEVPVKYNYTLIHIFIGSKRYFGEGDYDEGGFYALADIGLMIVPIKTTYDPFDEDKYYSSGELKETLADAMFDIGLGYEGGSDALKVFGEAKLAIPSSGFNSRSGTDSPLGIGLGLNLGVRFLLGQ